MHKVNWELFSCDITYSGRVPSREAEIQNFTQLVLLNGLSKFAQNFTVGFLLLLSTHPLIAVWGNYPSTYLLHISWQRQHKFSLPPAPHLWGSAADPWARSALSLRWWPQPVVTWTRCVPRIAGCCQGLKWDPRRFRCSQCHLDPHTLWGSSKNTTITSFWS